MKTINVSIQKTRYCRGRLVGTMIETRSYQTIAQTIAILQKHGVSVSTSTLYRLFRQPIGLVFVPEDSATTFVKIKLTTTYHELLRTSVTSHLRVHVSGSDRAIAA